MILYSLILLLALLAGIVGFTLGKTINLKNNTTDKSANQTILQYINKVNEEKLNEQKIKKSVNTLLYNIDVYDGTDEGQKEVL